MHIYHIHISYTYIIYTYHIHISYTHTYHIHTHRYISTKLQLTNAPQKVFFSEYILSTRNL